MTTFCLLPNTIYWSVGLVKISNNHRLHVYCFLNLGMEEPVDRKTEMLRGNVTCGGVDDDAVISWVSVCPSGLCKVQQKRSRGVRSMISIFGNNYFLPWPKI